MANFIALEGGKLKSHQMLSSTMADILSNLYLAHSINNFQEEYEVSSKLTNYCIQEILYKNQHLINSVIENIPHLKFIIGFSMKTAKAPTYKMKQEIIKEVKENEKILAVLKEDIQIRNSPLEKLLKLDNYTKYSPDYKKLYDEVIQVGEYNNV